MKADRSLFQGNWNMIWAALVVWSIFGATMSVLNLAGFFIPVHEEPIQISKEYTVHFVKSINSFQNVTTVSGEAVNMKLNGEIVLKSTLFSTQNPIDVQIKLRPNTDLDPNDIVLLKTLPQPFSVFFVNANNYYNKLSDNTNLAIIDLIASADSSTMSGNGRIVYSQSGEHEIYVLDPRETLLKSKLLAANLPSSTVILLPEVESPIVDHTSVDKNNSIEATIYSIPNSEPKPYHIEIKQADALNSLDADKQQAFGIWLTLVLAPDAIIGILGLRKR